MRKVKSISSISMFLFLLLLVACGSESTGGSGTEQGKEEQHLIYAAPSDIIGLSPIDTSHGESAKIFAQIYETLFVVNPDTSEIEPYLVDSYEMVDDFTWIFNLKQGIKFHDGTDFNAEAVKYTFEEILDPDRASPRQSFLRLISSIEVEDDYTLKIETEEPFALFLATLTDHNMSIISPTADKEGDTDTSNPVGTGPFVFDEWIPGDRVKLSKNTNYWGDEPSLDTFEMRVVPEFSTAVSMLETGEIDFIDDLRAEHLPRLESMDHVNVQIDNGVRVDFVAFNFDKEPFDKIEFRQAVTYAVNPTKYIQQLSGLGIENKSFVGPSLFGYKEEAQDAGHDYDLEKAKQLVEDHGFGDEKITILVQESRNYTTMAEIIQAQMTEAGFDVALETIDSGAYFDASVGGEYEMSLMSWTNTIPDGSALLYYHHSDNLEVENRINYQDTHYDELVSESRVTMDSDERIELIHEANVYVLEDYSLIPMAHSTVSLAHSSNVKGIQLDPNGTFLLKGVKID